MVGLTDPWQIQQKEYSAMIYALMIQSLLNKGEIDQNEYKYLCQYYQEYADDKETQEWLSRDIAERYV